MFGLTLTSRHVAELAAKDRVIAEKDRTAGQLMLDRDLWRDGHARLTAEVARLRKYEPVRDPVTNRFVGKGARLPRQDSYAGSDAARADAFAEAGKAVRHG